MSNKPFLYGKYVILDRLAMGGMAEVFRAQTFGVHGFQRLLVIKRILPHLSKDEEFVHMFIDEAKIAVALNHANICQVTDLGKIDDNYFIAMEYVNGKDLRAILKKCYTNKTPLGIEQSVFISSEICKGLEYAHQKKDAISGLPISVIHRDISPQNIMVSYHGEVKIVDFGIAKTESKLHKTQAGVLKGKFAYMSPEQSLGLELNVQTDVFSTGIILFEMLTNRRLFLGSTDFETLENIKKAEIPSIREINPKVSAELETVVFKSLARRQQDRYETAGQMQVALAKILYTEFSHFTPDHLSKKMSVLFEDDIKKENQALKIALSGVEAAQIAQAQVEADEETSQKRYSVAAKTDVTLDSRGQPRRKWIRYVIALIVLAGLGWAVENYLHSKTEKPPVAKNDPVSVEKTFVFETTPPKCKITVNGKVEGETPLNIRLALNQRFNVLLEKEGYQSVVKEVYTSSDNSRYIFELSQNKPEFGAVNVDTNPSGADIAVNGKRTNQKTPAIVDELPYEKDAELTFSKQGYASATRKISINEPSQDLRVTLRPRGASLRINVIPSNASIFLNGKPNGKIISDLTRGQTYALAIDAKGFEREERKIKIEGDQLELDIELKKKQSQTGSISISATPWATVVIDGKSIGTSPILNHALSVGKHQVVFKHPDFPDVVRKINIKTNDDQKLIIDLRQDSEK